MQDLLTVAQVAVLLRVHLKTIYKLVRDNRIPHLRIPGVGIRFDKSQVSGWIEKGFSPPLKKKCQQAWNNDPLQALKNDPPNERGIMS